MALDTDTEVTEIREVLDAAGNSEPPANASEQQKTNDRLGNHASVEAFKYTTSGTTAEQLPSNSVPEGVEVLILYRSANASDVFVGNSTAQPVPLTGVGQAVSYRVDNTDAIYIRTPTSGDGVGVTFEK